MGSEMCIRDRTDRTLDISAALHEAQLQRLEASLAAKEATKTEATSFRASIEDKDAAKN